MYFDTHAHYDDDWFDDDRDALIDSLKENGVDLVVNVGCDKKSSEASIALAEKYDFFYAAVGWHPHDARSWDHTSADLIREWSKHPKVVAIGEIGLDYHYDLEWKELQHRVFEEQLILAEELDLPVVVHDREAHGDCLQIIDKHPRVRGEFHCFSGSAEMAEVLVKKGWYLGFNGSVTMQGARRSIETLRSIPSDRILLETDCPYLAPLPRTDGKRNDSRKLIRIAEFIAEKLETSPQLVADVGKENGITFFGITDNK